MLGNGKRGGTLPFPETMRNPPSDAEKQPGNSRIEETLHLATVKHLWPNKLF